MISNEQLHSLVRRALSNFSKEQYNEENKDDKQTKKCIALTSSQVLVIAGLLGGALEVISILVDRDQTIQIILEGSLRQKTELDNMMDKIGALPFDEVLKAMLDRF